MRIYFLNKIMPYDPRTVQRGGDKSHSQPQGHRVSAGMEKRCNPTDGRGSSSRLQPLSYNPKSAILA